MNETIRLLNERKSVRVYEPGPLPSETKAAILNAALQAPTAGNMTLYTILDITDQALKDRLSETCDHQPFIAAAPLVLIFCADYHRWFTLFQQNEPDTRRPGEGDLFLAMADALIAAQSAVVAGEALGVSSCYIGDILENYEVHRDLLKLPAHVLPVAMVCFGVPTAEQKKRPKPPRFRPEDIVCENAYAERDLAAMLMERQGRTSEEFAQWITRFRNFKWDSDFSREMTRSVRAMLESWDQGK